MIVVTIINLVQIIVTLVHCNTMRASDIVYLSDKKETYYLLCMPMTKNQGVHSLHQAELLVRLMHLTAYTRPIAGILLSPFLVLFTVSRCAGAHIVKMKSMTSGHLL